MRRLVALTLVLTLAGGCATIASRPNETITVTTDPSGAEASLDCGSEKSVRVTPARFELARRTSDCSLTLSKEGFEKDTAILERGVNRWTWANLPVALVGVTVLGMSGFSDDPNQSAQVGGAFLVAGLGGFLIDRWTARFHDHDPKTLHVKLRPSR